MTKMGKIAENEINLALPYPHVVISFVLVFFTVWSIICCCILKRFLVINCYFLSIFDIDDLEGGVRG